MTWRERIRMWAFWPAMMVATTLVMIAMRDSLDQVHVVLVYLLIVLGASAAAGRTLAIGLACVCFLLIDYYFQQPYGDFSSDKPLDIIALVSFLVTAFVATDLLARAKWQATETERRAVEIASLARLGSETLSAGRAEDALARIADVIRGTLGISTCSIVSWDVERGFRASSRTAPGPSEGEEAMLRQALGNAGPTWIGPSGAVVVPSNGAQQRFPAYHDAVEKILMPLSVQGRMVGLLVLGHGRPMSLDNAQQRFLDAISYYAALAADRVRLVAAAEHAEALRETNRLKDILLASVSHDLRTPLTTIKALAQSEALQGNQSAAAIEEQADRLSRLVSDLLDLSRLKGGGFAVNPELNTAEDLIGAAVRQTRGLFSDRQLRTHIDLDSPALVGHFDFSQSLRVLANLLENAARYSPPGTPIDLAAGREGDMLVLSVADRGPGIDPADAGRIFEPFYRAGRSAPDAGRAGLGLSIAKTLAELQSGSLRYEPRSGGGSVFSLRLPAAEIGADALEPTA